MAHELEKQIDASQTTITLSFPIRREIFTASGHIQIDAEMIQYTNTTNTSFLGCVRGALGTVAAAHNKHALVIPLVVPATPIHVDSIHADASPNLVGDVQLVSGTNVTLSQVGQAITVAASGGASFPLIATASSETAPAYSFTVNTGDGMGYHTTSDPNLPGLGLIIQSVFDNIVFYAQGAPLVMGAFSLGSNVGETDLLLRADGTLVRVTVGANDSGGIGSRALIIPNA